MSCIRESGSWRMAEILLVVGENRCGKALRIPRDCSTRHDEVNCLLPPEAGRDAREASFFLECRPNGRRGPPRALRVAAHFPLPLLLGHLELLPPRDLVE